MFYGAQNAPVRPLFNHMEKDARNDIKRLFGLLERHTAQ